MDGLLTGIVFVRATGYYFHAISTLYFMPFTDIKQKDGLYDLNPEQITSLPLPGELANQSGKLKDCLKIIRSF